MVTCCGRRVGGARAFTLVELLVVIGLIALLLGLMMPTLSSAREQAKLVQCASTLRQLNLALQAYASANRNRYPPNLSFPSPGTAWHDPERIGKHLSFTLPTPLTRPGGPPFTCPNDDLSQRSYAMNVWASSAVDPGVTVLVPAFARRWSSNTRGSAQLILLAETWSSTGSAAGGFYAPPTIGLRGAPTATAGHRFGGGAGVTPFFAGPWGNVNCELSYVRHRKRQGPGVGTQPRGRINLGYADGHVATKSHEDLANPVTGQSTKDSLWCPGF